MANQREEIEDELAMETESELQVSAATTEYVTSQKASDARVSFRLPGDHQSARSDVGS